MTRDDLTGPGLAFDETADLRKGNSAACVSPQHAGVTGQGGELRECAMRRAAVSPAERAGMRGVISGSDGLPESERTIRGKQHARKPATVPRCMGRCAGRSARHGESRIT